ncbi:MAG: hypothetical protein JWN15_1511 [Firmicutes bacterium]|nr:hypothetical protein [Bacillota bacterium]
MSQAMRWFIASLLMLVSLVGVAYAQGLDTVTLPNGEHVSVEQDLNRTIITLSNGVQVTRTQMDNNASGWGGAVNLSSADLDKAQKAYDLWLRQHPPARKRSGNPVAAVLPHDVLPGEQRR